MLYSLGSYLFLLGCFCFVLDSYKAKNTIYFIGSLLFTIGTLCYILDSHGVGTDIVF